MAGKDAGRGGGRRVVVCDGVRGVFACGADGRWGLVERRRVGGVGGVGRVFGWGQPFAGYGGGAIGGKGGGSG